jgi:hypothetical protein
MRKRGLHLLILAVAIALSVTALIGGPAASAANHVPGQLAGVWVLPLGNGDYQDLLLADSRFEFFVNNPSGGFAFGDVSVSGNTITFYSSNQCSGTGTYQWSVSDGGLTFVALTADPCPRAQYLPAGTWTRR